MTEQINLFGAVCPECIFKSEYPQNFKFNLIANSQNFGAIEVLIKKGIEIAEIKGDKRALEELEKIGKSQAGKVFYYPVCGAYRKYISYPFKNAYKLILTLSQTAEETSELKDFIDFVLNVNSPIDSEILFKNTGIQIDY